ncbi:3'-5' exonuclease [Pantoea agglomerans]|uniref:3'-5' exonuclease n=1 Tax=Enterobacter agglomerans TaxID=549 RepID=UPI002B1DCF3E|nr:3'-5' exonuclease [Pantoea agglomerans]
MKALIDVKPTAEQLALFSRIQPGVEIIRGAAGSGKTTTALLKLRSAIGFYLNRRRRQTEPKPVNVLVLTFNKTLRGYIKELAKKQFSVGNAIDMEVSTFNSWSRGLIGPQSILTIDQTQCLLKGFGKSYFSDADFIADEAAYVLGRFSKDALNEYLTARRDGRGTVPRMERPNRVILLEKVIKPYLDYKVKHGFRDWNDNAIDLQEHKYKNYDVIVVDETQDFSANEIRAIMNQAARDCTITFVLDSAQKIYARSFNWSEVGINIRPENSHKLSLNYRNTKQIATLAAALLQGIQVDDDGSIPNLNGVTKEGDMPIVICGEYLNQVKYCISHIKENIDLTNQSVAFLHPKGWFRDLKPILQSENLGFEIIQSLSEWPEGDENIALTTFHSAKGLEFDHVIMIGLDGSVLDSNEVSDLENEKSARLQRLIAMGVGRAKESIIIGFSNHDVPNIFNSMKDVVIRRDV